MPGKGKYTTYSPEKTEGGKGKSNTDRLKRLFKTRPAEVDSKDALLSTANEKLLATKNNGLQQGDLVQFPGGVDLQFSKAPDIAKEVKVGGAGLPSTPYTPNLTSPGDPNGLNPTFQSDMEIKSPSELNKNAKEDVNGLVNPGIESKKMAQKVILGEDFPKGKRPGSDK